MGLGSYWGEVMEVLREIIPVYDKVNSIISLGKDVEHRNRGIKNRVHPGNKVLDAGSGFGNMSKTASKITNGKTSYKPTSLQLHSSIIMSVRLLMLSKIHHTPTTPSSFSGLITAITLAKKTASPNTPFGSVQLAHL